MHVTINGIEYEVLPRVHAMCELLIKRQHEIEAGEDGQVTINYHAYDVVLDARVVRERVKLSMPLAQYRVSKRR
jgi:hypothetical protein